MLVGDAVFGRTDEAERLAEISSWYAETLMVDGLRSSRARRVIDPVTHR